MAQILYSDSDLFPLDEQDRALVRAEGHELVEVPGHDVEEIVRLGMDAAGLLVYLAPVPADVIARLPACRVIARVGAGYDAVDIVAARAHGVEVVYVPDYGSEDIADHALALLFACLRRIVRCDAAVRAGTWISYQDLRPLRRLRTHVLGLVGYGRIARALGEKASALGMHVLAHDPYVEIDDGVVEPVGWEELFRRADAVSLHVPLTAATHHLVGAAELALMRPTAVLVNTSRGPVLDQAALLAALGEGRLACAGLDVFEVEPLPPDDPLCALQNVVLTPHSASFCEEALGEARRRALADVLAVLAGKAPRSPVPSTTPHARSDGGSTGRTPMNRQQGTHSDRPRVE